MYRARVYVMLANCSDPSGVNPIDLVLETAAAFFPLDLLLFWLMALFLVHAAMQGISGALLQNLAFFLIFFLLSLSF